VAPDPAPSRRRRPAAIVAIALAGLLAAACSGGTGSSASGTGGGAGGGSSSSSPTGPQLTFTPTSGSTAVKPGQGITVTSARGTLSHISVRAGGEPVAGTMNAARTSWHSTWALDVSTRYTVTATASAPGSKAVTQTSSFTTFTPSATARTMIFEGYHQTYGVGMPILLTFDHPVTNKAAVERALQIRSSQPVVGAWYWDSSTSLSFRPREYWPAHTAVTLTAHLNGVELAPGVYGNHTLTQQFYIGQSLIVVASTSTHHMNLYKDGKLFRHWPISTGKPGDNTPNGTYLTIEKGNPVLMKGPGYRIEVPWSVRFTWSGDYLHDAFWSTGQQGFTNVSHGCVNMAPADAKLYYQMADPGDPVTVTGSPRAGVWDNGWTHWFLTWHKFLKGSALHKAVKVGPGGSTFVNPAALPAMTGTAPLDHPSPGNWSATA
jgi:lipoprotein-anchoring transpeptidase ErfK/SrfK